MQKLTASMLVAVAVGCSAGDAPPLGGPYGSSNHNGGQNNNNGDGGGSQPQEGGTAQTNDAGSTTKTSEAGAPDSGGTTAPTWTEIFNNYLAGSKEGRCSGCHSQGSSPSALYSWLQGRGYISGASSTLASSSQSCLSWYGGNMPPSGPSDANAVSDMNAWAAAGAADN